MNELEASIRPITKELNELREKIKSMEHVEEISQELQSLKKKLAWAWVYSVDKEIQEHETKLEKLKVRIPTCQARIDKYSVSNIVSTFKLLSSPLYEAMVIVLHILDMRICPMLGYLYGCTI